MTAEIKAGQFGVLFTADGAKTYSGAPIRYQIVTAPTVGQKWKCPVYLCSDGTEFCDFNDRTEIPWDTPEEWTIEPVANLMPIPLPAQNQTLAHLRELAANPETRGELRALIINLFPELFGEL